MEKRPRDPGFAERLKKLLKIKGIKNNNQFAKAINKAPIVTLGWLKGKVPGYPEDWKLLCDFFDVSADHLLLGKGNGDDRNIKITFNIPIDGQDRRASDLHKFLGVTDLEKREGFRRIEDKVLWTLVWTLLKHGLTSVKDGDPKELKIIR